MIARINNSIFTPRSRWRWDTEPLVMDVRYAENQTQIHEGSLPGNDVFILSATRLRPVLRLSLASYHLRL